MVRPQSGAGHMTRRPDDLDALAVLSVQIGADPMLIQAAGGNTSVKEGDVMWIKASGTSLSEALERDIFVACDLPEMRASLARGEARADQPMEFAFDQDGLRPSIETSLHAVFPQRVVVHAHCIHTLAHVVQDDPTAAIGSKLDAFNWGIVPYAKPGADLATQVRAVVEQGRDVVILSNHGVIVAAETVAEAGDLLSRVFEALRVAPVVLQPADLGDVPQGWTLGPDSLSHIARDPARLEMATGGSLYPDHVIFCGVGAMAADVLPEGDSPPFVLIPGKGALMRADASSGAWALAQCLGDVLVRVPEGAALHYLTLEQNGELLDWDAEKYRQALNA